MPGVKLFQDMSSSDQSAMRVWEDGGRIALQRTILPLSSESHKGSSGRIAVLGGSARYTGAPYYAAMASLKAGADLAYVFTAQEASLPIKCYSPELMVAPIYTAKEMDELVRTNRLNSPLADQLIQDMVNEVTPMMDRLHCLVIGPGLGRCPIVFRAVARIIQAARERGLYLVLDADALYMLCLPEYRSLLRGYDKAILTPNAVEYKRLINGDAYHDSDLASVTIVQKGKQDVIMVGSNRVFTCSEEGGLKRSGGIGDVLAGTVGTLTAWHNILRDRGVASSADLSLACWTACCVVRRGTKTAYQVNQRAMTAPDVLEEIGPTIDRMTRLEDPER
jgi:ATP-dependent NAD(P)H-hydrate dehydratase